MTVAWYCDASGGFIPETPDSWNPQVAFLFQALVGAGTEPFSRTEARP